MSWIPVLVAVLITFLVLIILILVAERPKAAKRVKIIAKPGSSIHIRSFKDKEHHLALIKKVSPKNRIIILTFLEGPHEGLTIIESFDNINTEIFKQNDQLKGALVLNHKIQ